MSRAWEMKGMDAVTSPALIRLPDAGVGPRSREEDPSALEARRGHPCTGVVAWARYDGDSHRTGS